MRINQKPLTSQGGGVGVSGSFSDTFTRANSAFMGPTWMTGPILSLVGSGGAVGITAGVLVFQCSAITASDTVPFNAYPIAPLPAYLTNVNQFSQCLLSSLTGVVGTAIQAGVGVLSGFPLLTGDYRQYVLEYRATDANPANNFWSLCRTINNTRVQLANGAAGSALNGQIMRLEARVTAGVSTELKSFINGVLVNTTVDATASRTEIGTPFIGRTVWVGTGPINAVNFDNYSCGNL